MPILFLSSLRFLSRHPWQLALAIVAIAVGVAVIAAIDLTNKSARRAFTLSMDAVTGEATHQIVGGSGGIDQNIYTRLRVELGLRDIAPIVEGHVRIDDATLYLLGVDLFAERDFRNFRPHRDRSSRPEIARRLLTEPGAILLGEHTARSLGLEAGARPVVSVFGRRFPATVLATLDDVAQQGMRDVLLTDIATAQDWLGMLGRLSRIDVRVPAGAESEAWLAQLRAILPDDVQLLSAEGRTQAVVDMSDAFATNLTAMSLLALLVGVFLIFNSMSFAVLQRRSLFATLRALGVTRLQVFYMVVTEGVVLALLGGTLGIALGIWLGDFLVGFVTRSINDHYFVVNVNEVAISIGSLVKAAVAGLTAALLAVSMPALDATRARPSLALMRSGLERDTISLAPRLAALGITMAGAGLWVLLESDRSLAAGFLALFMLVLGFALGVPLVVRVAASLCAPLVAALGGTIARVAVGGVAAALSRTGVAIAALSVAVSASIGVSIMVGSFRTSVSHWLDHTLQSDIYVTPPGTTVGGGEKHIDPELIPILVGLPGIVDHSAVRSAWVESESGKTRIIALQRAARSHLGVKLLEGNAAEAWPALDHSDAIIVSDPYAFHHGIGPGDVVGLPTATGPHDFAVVGIYQDYGTDRGAIVMSRTTYVRHWQDPKITSLGLYLAPTTAPESLIRELRAVSEGRQDLLVRSNREIRELSLAVFDRTFVVTDVLYWLTVGVAFIGVLSAMLALQLERSREFGTLRALGMTPGQLGGLIGLQTGFIGSIAGLIALPLGLIMSIVLIEVINRRAFGWQIDLSVPIEVLATGVGLAVGASLLAGLYPAWHMANTSPAKAMREE